MFMVAALASTPAIGMAQTVMGVVVDSLTNAPIRGATVLIRTRDSTAASALTDSTGSFSVSAPRPGRYVVTVRRFGYAPSSMPEQQLDSGEVRTVRFRLAALVQTLDTIRTRAAPTTLFGVTSGRDWFTKHMREEKGIFFSGLEVLRTKRSACDYFASLPGLTYSKSQFVWGFLCVGGDIVTASHSSHCLGGRVDRLGPITGIDSANIYVRNRSVLTPEDTVSFTVPFEMVKGVEIFRSRDEIPKDLGIPDSTPGFAYARSYPFFGPKGGGQMPLRNCVWVQVWTELAW